MKEVLRNPVEIEGKLYELVFPIGIKAPRCEHCDLIDKWRCSREPVEQQFVICALPRYKNEYGNMPVWREVNNGNA